MRPCVELGIRTMHIGHSPNRAVGCSRGSSLRISFIFLERYHTPFEIDCRRCYVPVVDGVIWQALVFLIELLLCWSRSCLVPFLRLFPRNYTPFKIDCRRCYVPVVDRVIWQALVFLVELLLCWSRSCLVPFLRLFPHNCCHYPLVNLLRSLISISFIFAMSDKNSSLLDAVMEHVICFLSPVDAFALGEVFVGCRQFLYRSLNNSLAAVLDSGNTVFRTGSDPLQSFTSLARSLPPRSVCIRYV